MLERTIDDSLAMVPVMVRSFSNIGAADKSDVSPNTPPADEADL